MVFGLLRPSHFVAHVAFCLSLWSTDWEFRQYGLNLIVNDFFLYNLCLFNFLEGMRWFLYTYVRLEYYLPVWQIFLCFSMSSVGVAPAAIKSRSPSLPKAIGLSSEAARKSAKMCSPSTEGKRPKWVSPGMVTCYWGHQLRKLPLATLSWS